MHHKDKRRIIAWLKELREKHYVEWIYSTDFIEKTKPAIYYLGINGIRLLRRLGDYPPEELRKRYKESSRQQDSIARCLLLADCTLNLEARSTGSVMYSYALEADYVDPSNKYHFLSESELIRPHLCFVKQQVALEDVTHTTYLLSIFDASTPRYMVKKRLKDYVDYLDSDGWKRQTGEGEPPIVLLAFPTTAELIYAKRRTRKLLEEENLQDDEGVCIRFATVEQVKRLGVTGLIWEDA
jgi:hypothetical protein